MSRHLLTATFDAATELKDAGAVTANAAAQVGGVNRILNVGNAFINAVFVVDVDALASTTDQGYTVTLQGSTSPTFATDVHAISTVRVGKAAVTGDTADKGVGRYQKAFINSADGAAPLPYLRVNTVVAGTGPSVNFRAWITKSPL